MSCCGSTTPENLEKSAYERKQFSMDFSAEMSSGETINSGPTVTSTLLDGSASNLTIDDETISGQSVLFWIEGGTASNSYFVIVRVETSGGQKLEGRGILTITY